MLGHGSEVIERRGSQAGLGWRAGEQLTAPVNDDPEYLRALFNTESTWAAAQTSEALK